MITAFIVFYYSYMLSTLYSWYSHEPGKHLGLPVLLHIHHHGGELHHRLPLHPLVSVMVWDCREDGQAGVVRHTLVHGLQTIQTTWVVGTARDMRGVRGVGPGLE